MQSIKRIFFDPVDKTLEIFLLNNQKMIIGFTREIYFDVTLKIAAVQRSNEVGYAEIKTILNNLSERSKGLSPRRRKEYGVVESVRSLETCWQQYFQHKGSRAYTIVKANPSKLSNQEIMDILSKLFRGKGRGETAVFELADPDTNIVLPRLVYEDKKFYVGPYQSLLGQEKIAWISCVVDTESGFSKRDIKMSFLNEPIIQPREIIADRKKRLTDREIALKSIADRPQQIPWPGPTFSIQSFFEDRSPIAEHPFLSLILRPTDYFTFLSVQNAIKTHLVKDENGRPQSLGERYLSEYSPFVPIPSLAQSISGTVLLICKEDNKDYALIFKRSKRVATGSDVYVLSVNETPKRKPTEEEIKLLENIPSELIRPDLDENGDPCIFRAIVRGAKEELGVDLPPENIKILSFGLETDRYQYALIGIAETSLSTKQVINAFNEARDKPFEYSDYSFIPFTPESVYEFMRTHRKWGPEAEIGLYQSLAHKFGSEKVQKLFRDYPSPVIGISPAV